MLLFPFGWAGFVWASFQEPLFKGLFCWASHWASFFVGPLLDWRLGRLRVAVRSCRMTTLDRFESTIRALGPSPKMVIAL
jgi:hypothetical protein